MSHPAECFDKMPVPFPGTHAPTTRGARTYRSTVSKKRVPPVALDRRTAEIRIGSLLMPGRKFSRQSISPHKSHTSGSADAVAPAAVGVADGELVVGIGVEADIGVHPHAHATAQLQAVGLLQ